MLIPVLAWSMAAAQTVELPDRPTGSLRTRGMGGANVAVAEGASSVPDNPAAMAMRRTVGARPRQVLDSSLQLGAHPWLTAGVELLGGEARALPYPRARWRVGLAARRDRTGATLAVAEDSLESDEGRWVSRSWTVGLGRAGSTWADGVTGDALEFRRRRAGPGWGVGASAGALFAPARSPWRFGASVRSPRRTGESDGARLRSPFEAALGASFSVGARNVPGVLAPNRAAVRQSAEVLLLDADVVLTGGGGDAVAVLPLLESGERSAVGGPTVRVRAGAELAALGDRFRVRFGVASVPARGGSGGIRVGVGAAYEIIEAFGLSYRLAGYVGRGPLGWSGGLGGETW